MQKLSLLLVSAFLSRAALAVEVNTGSVYRYSLDDPFAPSAEGWGTTSGAGCCRASLAR